MDLFDLLILAALALPAIFRWIGERSRKDQPAPPPRPAEEADAESDFERALREIGVALGGVEPEPEEIPTAPVEEPVEKAAPLRRADLTADSAFSREEAFERITSEAREDVEAMAFRQLELPTIAAPEVERVASARVRSRYDVPKLLRRGESARQAILLSEVLRPPLALRDADGGSGE